MARRPNAHISEEGRAIYQANVIDVVNAFLDEGHHRVEVEFTQHKGDVGDKPDVISTHYAFVKIPYSAGVSSSELERLTEMAAKFDATISVDTRNAPGDRLWVIVWLPSVKKVDGD